MCMYARTYVRMYIYESACMRILHVHTCVCAYYTYIHVQLSMWKGETLCSIDMYFSEKEDDDDDDGNEHTEEQEQKSVEASHKKRVAGMKGDTALQTVPLHSKKNVNETYMNTSPSDLEKVGASSAAVC